MSRFRPTRASPPSKQANLADTKHPPSLSADISRSSAIAAPELMTLTQEEVDLLDAVVRRAGPSATTFLTVFKAYNDVLNERGLDPHEVVYYGKLLKLGTLKGRNWGEKWDMVKQQHHGTSSKYPEVSLKSYGHSQAQKGRPSTAFLRAGPPEKRRILPDDSFTLHSQDDETELPGSDLERESAAVVSQYHLTPTAIPRSHSPAQSEVTADSLGLDIDRHPLLSAPSKLHSMPPNRQHIWDAGMSEVTEGSAAAPSTTPPSYRAAVRNQPPSKQQPISKLVQPSEAVNQPPSRITSSLAARQAVAQARERKGSVVNEDDAWNKIKMQRDEKDADRFREDRLLERCWEVWKQGFQWIITTNEQIGEARDNLILRVSLQRWQTLYSSGKEVYARVSGLANDRWLKKLFNIWRIKLKSKQQAQWRQQMRLKMKAVREKREIMLKKDAWAKWRQSYRSHLSDLHYSERLVLRLYRRWKERLSESEQLETTAAEFSRAAEKQVVERRWNHWRRATELRDTERVVAERVSLRITGEVWNVWNKHMKDNHSADGYYDLIVMKNATRSWRTARGRIRAMENKADKHMGRQDGLLLRAVSRVWKARERGRLLERVRNVRLVKDAWAVWGHRIQEQKDNTDVANAFFQRSESNSLLLTFQTWRQVQATHLNANSYALQYYSVRLQYRILLKWRIHLRDKLKMIKMARMADTFFATRQAWKLWRERQEDKKRERRLKELDMRRVGRAFHEWLQRSRQQVLRNLAEQAVQKRVAMRIVRTSLACWTNRVIEVKLREIDIAQRHDLSIQRLAFKKWKGVCVRHVEELNLMESYQFVKREENIRRMFYRWLTVARAVRHRRITLQRKEDEMNFSTLSVVWDKWRDRFVDEKLRPIEHHVTVQTQRNILFRAFGIWHSKTKTLPAIRFYATHTKTKCFGIWKRAMPQALQAKVARDKDRNSVLSHFLENWVQKHRTKMALKAVARARYLRLPTAVPRQSASTPRPRPSSNAPLATRSAFPLRSARTESVAGDSKDAGPGRRSPTPKTLGARTGIVSLLTTRPRPERSPTRPKLSAPRTWEPSPTRSTSSFGGGRDRERDAGAVRLPFKSPSSTGGGEAGRGRLWLELREVQRKSRPPSEVSQPREPP